MNLHRVEFRPARIGRGAREALVRYALLNGLLLCSAVVASVGSPRDDGPATERACPRDSVQTVTLRTADTARQTPAPCRSSSAANVHDPDSGRMH